MSERSLEDTQRLLHLLAAAAASKRAEKHNTVAVFFPEKSSKVQIRGFGSLDEMEQYMKEHSIPRDDYDFYDRPVDHIPMT